MRPSEDWRDPLQKLGLRRTYRTWRVLAAIGNLTPAQPARGFGPCNREVADAAGIEDEGQASKLLKRLEGLGLIENTGLASRGKPNAWALTAKGEEALRELEGRAGGSGRVGSPPRAS
jgi:DNA-binding MarR family transcriptional regulator